MIDRQDAVMFVGLCLLVFGVGWIYRPLAPVLLGLVLMIFAYVTTKRTP